MSNPEIARLIDLASDVVARARRGGADVAEAIARAGSELSVEVRMGEPELVEEASHRALGMRVMKGKRVALTSTSDLSPAGLERFVSDALELAELSSEDPFAGPVEPSLLSSPPYPELEMADPGGEVIDAERARALATRGEDAARASDPRITNSDGSTFSRTTGGFGMALSSGFTGGYRGSYHSLYVVPVADDDGGKKRRGYHWSAKRHFADLDAPEAVGREAARRTLRKLGARKVPSCEAPVVFDPDAARSLLGAFAGLVMGGAVYRKSTYLASREGTAVASPLVQMVDDPLIPRAPGSRPFDGEGLRSRRNVVVDGGVLKTFLCDGYSARKLGRAPTGSASRGGSGGVGEGTSNFILTPGETKADEILRSTRRGLYVTEMMGFGFNPVTGDFSRGAAGFWIENGELAYPVGEITISLGFDELWKRVDAVGDDLDLRTATAAPTFRVSAMTIAGS